LLKIFSLYLVLLGLSWYIFLHLDILRHTKCLKKDEQIRKAATYGSGSSSSGGGGGVPSSRPSKICCGVESAHYTFSSGRHSGSFFLKIGAAGRLFESNS